MQHTTKYYNATNLPAATEKPVKEDWLRGFKENKQYLQLNPEKPIYATVLAGEYAGEVIQVLGYYDLSGIADGVSDGTDSNTEGATKQRWWYTENIPNYYTMMYQMWFKGDELDFS